MTANKYDAALVDGEPSEGTEGRSDVRLPQSEVPERGDHDFDTPFCVEWERAWSEEVNRREAEAVARGEPLIPDDVVMAEARALLRRHR
jgi:hypothetical protein